MQCKHFILVLIDEGVRIGAGIPRLGESRSISELRGNTARDVRFLFVEAEGIRILADAAKAIASGGTVPAGIA